MEIELLLVKFIFGGDEGDELWGVQCSFDLVKNDYWECFICFMECYVEVNGMGY